MSSFWGDRELGVVDIIKLNEVVEVCSGIEKDGGGHLIQDIGFPVWRAGLRCPGSKG